MANLRINNLAELSLHSKFVHELTSDMLTVDGENDNHQIAITGLLSAEIFDENGEILAKAVKDEDILSSIEYTLYCITPDCSMDKEDRWFIFDYKCDHCVKRESPAQPEKELVLF